MTTHVILIVLLTSSYYNPCHDTYSSLQETWMPADHYDADFLYKLSHSYLQWLSCVFYMIVLLNGSWRKRTKVSWCLSPSCNGKLVSNSTYYWHLAQPKLLEDLMTCKVVCPSSPPVQDPSSPLHVWIFLFS